MTVDIYYTKYFLFFETVVKNDSLKFFAVSFIECMIMVQVSLMTLERTTGVKLHVPDNVGS